METKKLSIVARVKEVFLTSFTGKIETLGSIFRHETVGLLPSIATIEKFIKILFLFLVKVKH